MSYEKFSGMIRRGTRFAEQTLQDRSDTIIRASGDR
jgi:hypothetical protein